MVAKKMTFPFGLWTLALGIGLAIGPLISALFYEQKYPPTSGFLVGFVLAVIAGAFFIFKTKKTRTSSTYPDLFGLFVMAASTALFVWGLIELPVRGVTSINTPGPLILGLIGFILFCIWEKNSKQETVLHKKNKKSFFTREFLLSALGSFILFFALFITYFLVPLYAKHIMHLTKTYVALSHSVLFGTITRLFWLVIWLGLCSYFLDFFFGWKLQSPLAFWQSYKLYLLYMIVGVFFADLFHLILDLKKT